MPLVQQENLMYIVSISLDEAIGLQNSLDEAIGLQNSLDEAIGLQNSLDENRLGVG